MSIHVALRHTTHYAYDRPVTLGPQQVRLRPAPHCRTPILAYSMKVEPAEHFINWQQDPQSNYVGRLNFPKPTLEFKVVVDLVAELAVYNPFDFFIEESAARFPFQYDPLLQHELAPFHETLPLTPRFAVYVASLRAGLNKAGAERPLTINVVIELNQRLAQEIGYLIRLEPGVQTPEQTLETKSGSCRDSAWLLCQIMRHLGLAARFVSGYIIQLKPDIVSLEGPAGASADFTDLHAWCEVFIPGAGWLGLDATSGLMAGEGHIPLACTPDPSSAAPITGLLSHAETEFRYEMTVARIYETPRVAKPYTPEQWTAIDTLGRRIDQDIIGGDMRLTVGGEPTFISLEDPEGPEWNVIAQSPKKRLLSGELIRRLQAQFALGGLLHYGQGKWYPGEALPRFSLGCYWRLDGHAMWEDGALIADEAKDYGHGIAEARAFADKLMEILCVDPRWLLPSYEDAFYYVWKERRLPSNVDPLKSQLTNKQERDRLARIFEGELGEVVAWVLPIHHVEDRWQSSPWYLRENTLWLIPGDSPVGYRLPLASLPWVKPSDFPFINPPDLSVPRGPLPPRARVFEPVAGDPAAVPVPPPPQPQESADKLARTALVIEPRNGRVHLFLPPVEDLVAYLDFIVAVEQTARELQMPIVLEGEPPPRDPRIENIKVTPDPGVIEVNLHPTKSWEQLVHQTKTLYEEARQMRLGTEKFMQDGRHTGTGGGNHIVLGAATPLDSPLLRRPDLLRSLVSYWHNHPALSYLFTGLFIGPTSQSPRVDEARNDALYELEIAFQQLPTEGEVKPWLVDRIFRNLLIDVTGNTHRTEFCIDKLYAPESSTGRLGLLELRSFEMPPHAEMSLAQHLLLRALLAGFWRQPYQPETLARWGTTLHDRFMLPHFIREDLQDVLADVAEFGYAIDPAWFAPHYEFRFPKIGAIAQRGVELELRSALEPWHVLGEEPAGGTTVRFVDSSVERMQVKVTGLNAARHLITCQGRRVPLHPTGTEGEFVAGVRYRAWQPAECLHPTIKVHAPLVFDVFDTWNQRSIGGCTYHVAHAGGINYESFPVNAYGAESRRLARFSPLGHTPGAAAVIPTAEFNREFPLTLDLRVDA